LQQLGIGTSMQGAKFNSTCRLVGFIADTNCYLKMSMAASITATTTVKAIMSVAVISIA
jgi:hypothetical protein